MASFEELYRLQLQMNNPLLNVQLAAVQSPRPLNPPTPTDNNVASANLFADQMNRISDMRAAQAQQEIENERARQAADLQMQTFLMQQRANERAAQAPPKLGQTPLWFRDESGALKIGRFGPEGIQFPETPGMTPVKPVQTLGIGGQELIMPYGAEQPTGVIQRTLPPEAEPETRAAQAAAVEQAKSIQAAQSQLPTAELQANRIETYIDEMINHPGLEAATGKSAILPVIPGTDRADFETRKAQLLGGAFLQGYQMLRGGGTVTETEGAKAEQSLLRMSTATKKEDFVKALEDYRQAVRDGVKKLRESANLTEQTPTPPPGFVME